MIQRTLLLTGMACLLAAIYVWATGDPWDAASAKGAADAQALRAVQDEPDRISFYLAKDTALLKAVVWSPNGSVLYPGPRSFVPTQFDMSQEALSDLTRATSERPLPAWSRYDRDGTTLLYCQSSPRICLIYDKAALQNALQMSLHMWRGGVGWALGALGTLCLLLSLNLIWRRQAAEAPGEQFVLLPEQHSARHGTLQVALTPRDFRLLDFLQQRRGTVVTKDELYDAGWGRDFMPNSRALDQHIINLRKKLDPDKTRSPVIETVRGVGYKLVK